MPLYWGPAAEGLRLELPGAGPQAVPWQSAKIMRSGEKLSTVLRCRTAMSVSCVFLCILYLLILFITAHEHPGLVAIEGRGNETNNPLARAPPFIQAVYEEVKSGDENRSFAAFLSAVEQKNCYRDCKQKS